MTFSLDDDFLENDGRILRAERQRVDICGTTSRQRDHTLYHTACYSGIVNGMDVLWVLVQTLIEVDGLWFSIIQLNGKRQATLVQIVECGFCHYSYTYHLFILRSTETIGQ